MTANQINYWNYVESKRANLAREAENFRHNFMNEKLTRTANEEIQRHNIQSEILASRNVALGYAQNATQRASIAESARHNLVSEMQNSESISNSYSIGLRNSRANLLNASTNSVNAETRKAELEQTKFRDTFNNVTRLVDSGVRLITGFKGR